MTNITRFACCMIFIGIALPCCLAFQIHIDLSQKSLPHLGTFQKSYTPGISRQPWTLKSAGEEDNQSEDDHERRTPEPKGEGTAEDGGGAPEEGEKPAATGEIDWDAELRKLQAETAALEATATWAAEEGDSDTGEWEDAAAPTGNLPWAEKEEQLPPGIEVVVVEMTKPLGISIEETISDDNKIMVYIPEVGEKALEAGVKPGDVIVGISAIFGDAIWPMKGQTAEKITSMVRSRDGNSLKLKLERGHGFDLETMLAKQEQEEADLASSSKAMGIRKGGESDLDYKEVWRKVYTSDYDIESDLFSKQLQDRAEEDGGQK